jgi:uncharacterized protein (TIGR03086 family)
VGRLSRERGLLESAISYALAEASLVTPQLLSRPTPCFGWDLEALLDHVVDSIRVLHRAIATEGGVAPDSAARPGLDPVARLRRETARLVAASASRRSADGAVSIGDRELSASVVTVAGAMEIAVHGWDISVACGGDRPIPSSLAALFLPIAPFLITAETRPGLFADPVRLARPAGAGDELVAFLGRQPDHLALPESPNA